MNGKARPEWDDNPEWTEEDFASAKPAAEIVPPEAVAMLVRKRGRPPVPEGKRKRAINLSLSPDVIAAMRATGPNWQRRADEVLRKAFVR